VPELSRFFGIIIRMFTEVSAPPSRGAFPCILPRGRRHL